MCDLVKKFIRLSCIVIFLVSGCTPREKGGETAVEGEAGTPEGRAEKVIEIGTGAEDDSVNGGLARADGSDERTRIPPSVSPASPPSPRESMLVMRNSPAILPEDFAIGALATLMDGGEPARVTRGFIEGLSIGIIDANFVHQDRLAFLRRSLSYYLDRGDTPRYVRIGRFEGFEGTGLKAGLRIFGSSGRTECEIYLSRDSGSWRVYDFQGDLSLLGAPYAGPEGRFEPSFPRMTGPVMPF